MALKCSNELKKKDLIGKIINWSELFPLFLNHEKLIKLP